MFFHSQKYYCVNIRIYKNTNHSLHTCLAYNHRRSIMQAIITINREEESKKTFPENRYPIKIVFKNNIER